MIFMKNSYANIMSQTDSLISIYIFVLDCVTLDTFITEQKQLHANWIKLL